MERVEAFRIAVLVIGGAIALGLVFAPAVASRGYARAVVAGRARAAGFWGFLAAGAGSGARPSADR